MLKANSMSGGAADTPLEDDRWAEVRLALKKAEDDDGAWWDKNEIREAIVRANAMDIEPSIVLSCFQACSSQEGLVRRAVRGPLSLVDVVVATPGRLVDHLKQTAGFTLSHLRFLVSCAVYVYIVY